MTILAISLGLGIGTWGMFGSQSALMSELFGARHRYLGVCVTREVSAVLSGGIAPLIGAWIIARMVAADGGPSVPGAGQSAWVWIASYLSILTLITIATTFVTPETAQRDLDDPGMHWRPPSLRNAAASMGLLVSAFHPFRTLARSWP